MRRIRVSPALVVSLVALFFAVGGTGFAATGGNFILGHANTAEKATKLTADPASGAALTVKNSTTSGPAAAFNVSPLVTPFTVNSSTQVAKLNASLLGGQPASGFVQGGGQATAKADAAPAGQSRSASIPGLLSILLACPANLALSNTVTFTNVSGGTMNLFLDTGGTTTYHQLAEADTVTQSGSPAGQTWTVRLQVNSGPPDEGVATIEVAAVNRPSTSDCHIQSQAVFTPY